MLLHRPAWEDTDPELGVPGVHTLGDLSRGRSCGVCGGAVGSMCVGLMWLICDGEAWGGGS